MAKPSSLKLNWTGAAIVGVFGLAFFNYLSARTTGFPFLYCWTGPMVREVYLDVGMFALYLASAYTLYSIWRRNVIGVISAVMVFTLVTELPRLADMVFRSGGSCG